MSTSGYSSAQVHHIIPQSVVLPGGRASRAGAINKAYTTLSGTDGLLAAASSPSAEPLCVDLRGQASSTQAGDTFAFALDGAVGGALSTVLGTASLTSDGYLRFDALAGAAGTETIRWTAVDSNGLELHRSETISVAAPAGTTVLNPSAWPFSAGNPFDGVHIQAQGFDLSALDALDGVSGNAGEWLGEWVGTDGTVHFRMDVRPDAATGTTNQRLVSLTGKTGPGAADASGRLLGAGPVSLVLSMGGDPASDVFGGFY